MKRVITRYAIPGAALLLVFAVSGVVVFAVATFMLGDDDDAGSGQLALQPTATATLTPRSTVPPVQASMTATVRPTTLMTTPTPAPATVATLTPVPTPPPTPQPTEAPPPPAPSNFAGTWRIVDTVVQGAGAGQSFAFQVVITQSDSELRGGAGGAIALSGTVAGNIATVQFTQPGLGVTGIFIWTLNADGNATGTFTSSASNSGTSQLIRLR